MNLFRFLFPSFEKPVERPRYLNIEPEAHDFRGIGTVLLLAASCGVALALWEPSHQVTSPFATASVSPPACARPPQHGKVAIQETTASADAEDDQPAPTVRLSTLCSQRATARRDCASAKAVKEARLKAPDPDRQPRLPRKRGGRLRSCTATALPRSRATQACVAAAPAEAPRQAPQPHRDRAPRKRSLPLRPRRQGNAARQRAASARLHRQGRSVPSQLRRTKETQPAAVAPASVATPASRTCNATRAVVRPNRRCCGQKFERRSG